MNQESKEFASQTATSSKSTKRENKNSSLSKLKPKDLSATSSAGKLANSAASLESKLEEEKSQRKIERFFWILALSIVSLCLLIKFLDNTLGTLFLMLLCIILLIGCAQWLEVPWIVKHLETVFKIISRRLDRQGSKTHEEAGSREPHRAITKDNQPDEEQEETIEQSPTS
jgi:hypothetical protein